MNLSLLDIRWRLFWSSIVAIVLAIGCFSLTQWAYAPSTDECLWSVEDIPTNDPSGAQRPRVVIRAITPKGAADAASLVDGDELVAIHDFRIPDHSYQLTYEENSRQIRRAIEKMTAFINSTPDGTTVLYTVIRDGQRMTHPLELKKEFDTTNAVFLLTGIVAWAIGLLVVLSSPQRKVTRHFYYLGVLTLILAAGASTKGNYTVPLGLELTTNLCWLLVRILLPPMWLHFFLRFPYGFEIKKYRYLLIGIYVANILVMLPEIIISMGLAISGLKDVDWILRILLEALPVSTSAFNYASGTLQLLLLGAGVVLFWVGAFKIPGRRRKALMAPLLFSMATIVDLVVYIWFAGTLTGPDWAFFHHSGQYMVFPLPLLPVTFAYAILRHGLFDVRRVIVRWLSYFVALGTLVITYLGAIAFLFAVAMPTNIPMAWLGVVMGLLALPLGGLFQWLLVSLRRRFKKDIKTAHELILGNLRETKNRFSDEALLNSVTTSIHVAFRPQLFLCLPAINGRVNLPPIAKDKSTDSQSPNGHDRQGQRELKLPPTMLRHAKDNRELVFGLGSDESDWIQAQSMALRKHLDALGAQILVLLMNGDYPHSVLLLGGKYAELNYNREDRELLREVAIATGALLETADMHRSLIDKTRMDQELHAAQKIQESLITSDPPDIAGFQIASRLVPAAETGGDLLWVKQRAPGRWIAVVGDVSGKGLAAAIYMSQSMALLKFALLDGEEPLEKIVADMDLVLRSLMSARDFLTLSIIEWNENGQFKVVRAGHPPPILLAKDLPEKAVPLIPPGLALGMLPACMPNWKVVDGILQPGDWIAMYSDGITEAMDGAGNLYGMERLTAQLVRFWGTGSSRAACEAIFNQVAAFETQNRDDRTLFILAREK
ncbi:MAG: SpoIIE family protein phosphatase [Holophagaceae bacterium]|nr:SpoIIE family protein phosphatase [Holophagaceae bacterium]